MMLINKQSFEKSLSPPKPELIKPATHDSLVSTASAFSATLALLTLNLHQSSELEISTVEETATVEEAATVEETAMAEIPKTTPATLPPSPWKRFKRNARKRLRRLLCLPR